MKNTDISDSLKQLTAVIKRTHYLAFGLLLAGIIGLTCMFVISTLNMPSDTAYELQLSTKRLAAAGDFEKDPTIARIDTLKFSEQQGAITLPANQRIEPFIECRDNAPKQQNKLTTDFSKCYNTDRGIVYILECYDDVAHGRKLIASIEDFELVQQGQKRCYDVNGNLMAI